jgi:hypothetical protein
MKSLETERRFIRHKVNGMAAIGQSDAKFRSQNAAAAGGRVASYTDSHE